MLLAIISVVGLMSCASSSKFQRPKVISDQPLDYPLSAQLDRIEGDVLLAVYVEEDGTPQHVKIVESSGNAELDSAAYRFAHDLSFKPALLDENQIASWTKLLLRYRLSELPFERDTWLQDVKHYQKQIAAAEDSTRRQRFQKKLIARYVGLLTYCEKFGNPSINRVIKRVISSEIKEVWNPFWNVVPAPFAVFDDFLYKYPETPYSEDVKQKLLTALVRAEGRIRVKSFNSDRMNREHLDLLRVLEERQNALQNEQYEKIRSLYEK